MKIPNLLIVAISLTLVTAAASSHTTWAAMVSSKPAASKPATEAMPPPIVEESKKPIPTAEHVDAKLLQKSLRQDASSVVYDTKRFFQGSGLVTTFEMPPLNEVPRSQFFWRYARDLNLSPTDRMKEFWVQPDFLQSGATAARYQQHFRAPDNSMIEVRGGECVLWEKHGILTDGSCHIIPGLTLDVTNPLAQDAAIAAAETAVTAKNFTFDAAEPPSAQLMIVPKGRSSDPKNYRLVWSVIIYTSEPLDALMVDVLAKPGTNEAAGDILQITSLKRNQVFAGHQEATGSSVYPYNNNTLVKFSNVEHKNEGDIYQLLSGGLCAPNMPPGPSTCMVPPGVLIRAYDARNQPPFTPENPGKIPLFSDDDQNDNWWQPKNAVGVSAFWGLQQTIQYFYKAFGEAEALKGTYNLYLSNQVLHAGYIPLFAIDPSTQTKALAGATLYFPTEPPSDYTNGPQVSLDIVGHEFVHHLFRVFNKGMTPFGESGSIEEGFADALGILTRFEVEKATTQPDWLFGKKDCSSELGYTGCYFLSLAYPKGEVNCPYHFSDTYGGVYFGAEDSPCWIEDQCVHENSSIVSHWFYLLVNGGSGTNDSKNPWTVKGIDLPRAQLIAYVTLSLLQQDDNFEVLREKTSLVARSVARMRAEPETGPDSLPASVEDAWYAVGVGNAYDARTYTPWEGATEWSPWPAKLTWDAFPGEVKWVVRVIVNTVVDQQKTQYAEVDTSACAENKCSASFNLKPDTTYNWMVIAQSTQKTKPIIQGDLAKAKTLDSSAAATQTAVESPSFFSRIASSISSFFTRGTRIKGPEQKPMSLPGVPPPGNPPPANTQEAVFSPVFTPTSPTPPDVVPGKDGWGNWGRMVQFTTNSNKPKVVPAGHHVNPWNAVFKFEKVDQSTSYDVQVSETVDFAKIVTTATVDPADPEQKEGDLLKATVFNLKSDTSYYWRVTAIRFVSDDQGPRYLRGTPSNADHFLTIRPTTDLITPLHGAQVNPLNIELKWSKVDGATGYRVIAGKKKSVDAKGRTVVVPDQLDESKAGGDVTSHTISWDSAAFPQPTTFYWQVTPKGPGPSPEGEPSLTRSFEVRTELSAVTGLSPTMMDSVKLDMTYNEPVLYVWTYAKGATGYTVTIIPQSGGNPIVIDVPQGTPEKWDQYNAIKYVGSDATRALDPNGYCWSVVAKAGSAVGKPSSQLCYRTGTGPIQAGYPNNNQTIGTTNQLFGWTGTSAPWGFYMHRAWISGGSPVSQTYGPLYDDNGNLADGSFISGNILDAGEYDWRICAIKGTNDPYEPCSEVRHVIVKADAPQQEPPPGSGGSGSSGSGGTSCSTPGPTQVLNPEIFGKTFSVSMAPQIEVRWKRSDNTTSYMLYVGIIPDGCDINNPASCLQITHSEAVPQSTAGTNPFRYVTSATPNTMYGVRIEPWNDCGFPNDSSKWIKGEIAGTYWLTTP